MKRAILFSLLAFTLIAAATVFSVHRHKDALFDIVDNAAASLSDTGAVNAAQDSDDLTRNGFDERDEIRRTVQLRAGARVEVAGINGAVDIETGTSDTAEILIVRTARSRADLEHRKVIVEASPDSLVVRGEKDDEKRDGRSVQVRQRVTLKLPRQVELTARGINGRVRVGEVDGAVKVSGINGAVDVEQASGYSKIDGINGRVQMTIKNLGERGIEVSGVNGAVDLRFADDLNADLRVSGVNGKVTPELPDVTLQGEVTRNNFRARIGAGGSPITASGINGSVRLSRTGSR
ncbi:MAG: hypothetical protein MSG64_16885 [Pyrinomonadaceae bacterium MAG19_C2-C3]|nr:hypothetical protein [Pyrinomonadaceae bacterium MAG19_C2-C3]